MLHDVRIHEALCVFKVAGDALSSLQSLQGLGQPAILLRQLCLGVIVLCIDFKQLGAIGLTFMPGLVQFFLNGSDDFLMGIVKKLQRVQVVVILICRILVFCVQVDYFLLFPLSDLLDSVPCYDACDND